MKRITKTIAIVLALVFMFSNIAFAGSKKEGITLTPDTIKQLKYNATRDGIDQETQDKLIAKLKKGDVLDCMEPSKLAEAKKHLKVSKDKPRAEYIFPDGSKYVLEVNVSDEVISPMGAITRNVNAYAGSFIYNANFWANITTWDGTAADTINSLGAHDIYSSGGYVYYKSKTITNAQEDPGVPAKAILKWDHKVNGYTYHDWLQLNVGNDDWWETFQM